MIKKRIVIASLFLVCAAVSIITGCFPASKSSDGVTNISSYRHIPGITDEEIAAVEALKSSGRSLHYESLLSTEAFVFPDGTNAGFTAAFTKLLSELFEIPFVPVFYEWETLKSRITGKYTDFTGDLTPTAQRKEKFFMTEPIAYRSLSVFTYGDSLKLESELDLDGLKIGFLKGSIIPELISRAYPALKFEKIDTKNNCDAVKMMRDGTIDAFITGFVEKISFSDYPNVRVSNILPLVYAPVSMATAKSELQPIISVVNKYIAAGGNKKLHELYRAGNYEYVKYVLGKSFTAEENAYIKNSGARVPIALESDNYPISFYNREEGEFQGIAIDVLEEISKLTGIEFYAVSENDALWAEVFEIFKSGKAAAVTSLFVTEERKEYFLWNDTPYMTSPYAFISKSDLPNLEVHQIAQSIVGTIRGAAYEDMYHLWFPSSQNLKLYGSKDDLLDALEKGEIELALTAGYTLLYQTNFREKPRYKINFAMPVYSGIYFGFNKSEEVLRDIFNKTLEHINTDKISRDWTNRTFDYSRAIALAHSHYMTISIYVLLLVLLILIVFAANVVKNKNVIAKQAAELELREKMRCDLEYEVAKADERIKLMLDSSPLCCEIWDGNLNVIDCNEASIRFLKLNSKEEYLSGIFNFSPEFQPDGQCSVEKAKTMVKKAFTEGRSVFDWQHVLLDGTLIPVEVTLVPVKHGSDTFVVAYTRDLRKYNKMMEEIELRTNELTLQKATLQTIIDSMPDFVFCKDLNFRYTLLNTSAAKYLNFNAEDVLGKNDVELEFPVEVANKMIENDKKVFNGEKKVVYDDWIPAYDGTLRYFETTKAPIMQNGVIVGLVGVSRDITDKMLMEKKLEAALEQAQAGSKAKGDFLSTMSHEMRTPMNAIIGMTAIGEKTDDLEDKNTAFGKIRDASSHLLGVINDVLDMAKIEADKLELVPIEYNFERMLQKVMTVIQFRADEKQQRLSVNIDKKIPRFIVGDDQRLSQVITNILSNAVKFTPEGGSICFDASLVEIKGDACELRIEITDNGIGISPEKHQRMFHAFEQAESGTSREYGGTGLGLVIAKRIVELMDGEINVESELGKGAKFIFTVKARIGEKNPVSLLSPDVNWDNIRILVVDDMPEIREQFQDIFSHLKIKCDVAEDGVDACDTIEKNGAYDIYFVDWRMPRMDGIELTKRIKSRENGRQSVVIMITAMDWKQIKEQAIKAGVDKHLLKPLFSSSVIDCVNECLGTPCSKTEYVYGEFTGKRMLLVEDIEVNREIIITLLRNTGLVIDSVENGLEALNAVSDSPQKYDIVFMDIQMPVMDGYKATRLIRALPNCAELPIVAMTANVFKSDIEACLEAGMNTHLGKPMDIDKVLDVLRKYLNNRSRSS